MRTAYVDRSKRGGRRRFAGRSGVVLSALVTAITVAIVVRAVDAEIVGAAAARVGDRPLSVAAALAGFAAAFMMRAVAWRRVLPTLPFGHAWSSIHVALGANHMLPFRLGEAFRVINATRRASVPIDAATASTITLRSADVLTMVGLGVVVAPAVFVRLIGPIGWLLLALVAVVAAVSWRWLFRLATGRGSGTPVRLPGLGVLALSAAAWIAESVVVWEAARWVGVELAWSDAILVATVAVAAQIAAITPGGFGTYEAASVAAYVAIGVDPDAALVAALGAHGLKTAYSLVAGAVAVVVPAPSLLGRFRLPVVGRQDAELGTAPVDPEGDAVGGRVLLFMPAYNEVASVAACVERSPAEVFGLPVDVLVIDDGSTDATAERAAAAGAEVLQLGQNQGLGAAVRVGLAEGVARRAAAVVFCDADGEYPPEELAALVRPILAGEADYVTGSRFLGRIDHMRPHRRIGNIFLTLALSAIARIRISDGQTGYRAFSPAAALAAEVIHDFNYAQVITLDLLAKGFRMREVPISYHFRTEGESFVKLGRYLRNVVPAVYRELNTG